MKAYEAGINPVEFYDLTLKEVLQTVNAYHQRQLQYFNFNTRMIGWQLEKAFSGKDIPFETFWNTAEETDINKIGEDLQARAEYMRAMLRKNGYLKN